MWLIGLQFHDFCAQIAMPLFDLAIKKGDAKIGQFFIQIGWMGTRGKVAPTFCCNNCTGGRLGLVGNTKLFLYTVVEMPMARNTQ